MGTIRFSDFAPETVQELAMSYELRTASKQNLVARSSWLAARRPFPEVPLRWRLREI